MLDRSFICKSSFVFKHKAEQYNKVANSLSRKHKLLIVLSNEITSFESLPKLYANDEDFVVILEKCVNKEESSEFHV